MDNVIDVFIFEPKVYVAGESHKVFSESVEKWKQPKKRNVVYFHSSDDFIAVYNKTLKNSPFRLWVHLEYNKNNPSDSGGIYIASNIKEELKNIKLNLISRTKVHEKEIDDFSVYSLTETSTSDLTEIEINTMYSHYKVFISHSSKDKKVIDNFVNKILDNGLNLSRGDIFYTSIESMSIKSGDDFRNSIHSNILNSNIVLLMISENYRSSEICLNEMGAAWALNKKTIPLLLPPIAFDSVGCLMEVKQCTMLNDKKKLLKVCEELKTLFSLNASINDIDNSLDEFIESIK